jgi:hypothetical protein
LWSTVEKGDWPKFLGQGEYDHLKLIQMIDTVKADSSMPDKIIQMKLLTILTRVAGFWYQTMCATVSSLRWLFWKNKMTQKFSTSDWKRKKQDTFEKDKFIAGETLPASWVTRQFKRFQAFELHLPAESFNFCLLGLMDRELEYAAKTAMDSTTAAISNLINVLAEIVDKTL